MLSRMIWVSVAGNIMLAISAWLLFNSNTDLHETNGRSVAQIATYQKSNEEYKGQLEQCRSDKIYLITEHTKQVNAFENISKQRELAARDAILGAVKERGRVEAIIRGIRMPEVASTDAERLRRIEAMVDSYVEESNR